MLATDGSIDGGGSRPCSICKAVHVACDRKVPCGRCVRLGKAEFCQEAPLLKRGRKPRNGKVIGSGHGVSRHLDVSNTQPTLPSPLVHRAAVVLDPQGRVVSASAEFCSLLGAELDELMGYECVVVPPPTAESPLPCALSSALLASWQPQPQQLLETLWQSYKIANRTRASASTGRSVMLSCHARAFVGDDLQPLCTRLTVIKVNTPLTADASSNETSRRVRTHSDDDDDDDEDDEDDSDDEAEVDSAINLNECLSCDHSHFSDADDARNNDEDEAYGVKLPSHKRHVSRQPTIALNPKQRRSSEESAAGSPHRVLLENSEHSALPASAETSNFLQVSWDPYRFE